MIFQRYLQSLSVAVLALSNFVFPVFAEQEDFWAPGGKYTLKKADYYTPLENFKFPIAIKNEWLFPREQLEWIRFIRGEEARVVDRIIPVCNFHIDLEFFYERPDLNSVLTEMLCGKQFRVYLTEDKYISYAPDGKKQTPNEVVDSFIKLTTPKLVNDLILYRYRPEIETKIQPFRYIRSSRIFAPCGKFVSVALLSWDFTTGAYSSGEINCFTLDTTTGRCLQIDDILTEDFEKKLKEMGPWPTDSFYPDGVILLPTGILLVQNYLHHGFYCFFSINEIRSLLKPGILAVYENNNATSGEAPKLTDIASIQR